MRYVDEYLYLPFQSIFHETGCINVEYFILAMYMFDKCTNIFPVNVQYIYKKRKKRKKKILKTQHILQKIGK